VTLHEEHETALTGDDDVVIGVDIGGTNTAVGVVDPKGHELLQARFQT
jgi:predicted NBD/HSP70 family sugar kinase